MLGRKGPNKQVEAEEKNSTEIQLLENVANNPPPIPTRNLPPRTTSIQQVDVSQTVSDIVKQGPPPLPTTRTAIASNTTIMDNQANQDQIVPPKSAAIDGVIGPGGRPVTQPATTAATLQRVLQLCQKGEWPAVELILRALEKANTAVGAAAGLTPVSFAGVVDENSGFSPLMYAVKENKVFVAEKLLDLNSPVTDRSKGDNMTALHLGATYAKEEMLRLFLLRKADANVLGGAKRQLPIHMACSRAQGSTVGLLQILLRMSDRESRLVADLDGDIPLFLAVEVGNLGMCKELLTQLGEQQVKFRRKKNGDTALHMAARRHDIDLVKMFVDFGASVDAQNDDGFTVLHIAAMDGDENLVKFLYVVKANPNVLDIQDRTPLAIATEKGHTGIVELLAEKFRASVHERTKDGNTLLHIASLCGHPETALAFLKRGVPLRMPNKAGARCIHTAVQRGHVGVVNALLQKGEDVDAKTNENYTALHIAVEAGKAQVVECLLGYGAQVDLKGGENLETPLHIAARIPDGDKCAEMLIKSGAKVNAEGENGETSLHIAARYGNLKSVQLMLENGANTMKQAKSGESALHVAVRHCHFPIAEELLKFVTAKKNKDEATKLVNMQTQEGDSALHCAAQITKPQIHYNTEDADIIRLLLEYGGDANLPSKKNNETPLHYCSRAGNADIMREIVRRLDPGVLMLSINKQTKNGWSPLLVACEYGHVQVVRILLQNQARADVFDESGMAALHLASERGHKDVVNELLHHKAFVNARNKIGITPLHLAAMNGFNDLVKSLVDQHNAMLDATTLNKRTPLHLAAQSGQLQVCNTLLEMRSDPTATDQQGQTPLHLAAENDHSDVVKLFLKHRPELVTMANTNGFTCAHIAAMKGSVAVLRELMKFNKSVVTTARNRTNDSTTMHLAAEGGHADVVKVLLEAGASATDENREGHTAIHLAAKHGHLNVLEALRGTVSWKLTSKKTGLMALHVAAHYGQAEFAREMLTQVPAMVKSEAPAPGGEVFIKDTGADSGFTALHLAAQSGHENVVRLLLNYPGIQADAPTNVHGIIPLHLAAQGGYTLIVGLLLSKSAEQLHTRDKKGRTGLHLAAASGHYDMVALLLGSGADINAPDQSGWTPLHFTAKQGNIAVVKLLVESGATTWPETKDGKIPICFAVASGHLDVLSYLLTKDFNVYSLMEDKKFLYDLMISGKNSDNKPIEELVLASPAPADTATKLARQFTLLSTREKDRTRDLETAGRYCEAIATELMAIASSVAGAGVLLRAVDNRNVPFLDVLIENEQKEVVAHSAVQKYVTEVWIGNLQWGPMRFILLFFAFLLVPPIWVAFCLPVGKYNKIPIIKFMAYLASHIFFMALLVITVAVPLTPIYDSLNMIPHWNEWLVVAFLSGMLLSELTNPGDRAGLGWLKIIILIISACAIVVHGVGLVFSGGDNQRFFLYVRNQFLAVALLLSFVLLLDFLTLHYLFGPWAIIIRNLMQDLGRFLVILAIFVFGFTFHVTAIYQPVWPTSSRNMTVCKENAKNIASPLESFEMLFNALFGLVEPGNLPCNLNGAYFAENIMKVVLGLYMTVTVVVLINLLIAMMSDTYQRIQAQSDLEWKFGRAKLIHNMNKTSGTPSPINLLSEWIRYIYQIIKHKGNICSSISHQYMKKKEAREEAKAVDRMTSGRRSWMKMAKRNSKVGPTDNFFNTVRRLSLRTLGPAKLESVVDWQAVNYKYMLLMGQVPADAEENTESADSMVT